MASFGRPSVVNPVGSPGPPKFSSSSSSSRPSTSISTTSSLNTIPRYAHIRATIDTGRAALRKAAAAGAPDPYRHEPFKRITCTQVHTLLDKEASLAESVYRWEIENINQQTTTTTPTTTTTTTATALHTPYAEQNHTHIVQEDLQYVLIDVREAEEYEKVHILGAINVTSAMFRSDRYGNHVYAFREGKNKAIILYDSDSTSHVAIDCAVLCVQKGFQTVYVMTGGIAAFAQKFAQDLQGDREVALALHKTQNVKNRRRRTGTITRQRPETSGSLSPTDSISRSSAQSVSNFSVTSTASRNLRIPINPSLLGKTVKNPFASVTSSRSSHRG